MADPSNSDDETGVEPDLIARIRAGDVERYAELMARHQGHVARLVGRRVPPDRVDDVVQDVFVRAYLALGEFSGSVPFEHWLAGIAVRACMDFWRGRGRAEIPVSALTEAHREWTEQMQAARSEEAFQAQARRREAADLLEWALRRLSAEERAVLTLVHLEGRSIREAADLLGWSTVTVKVRAHRARRALRGVLDEHLRGTYGGPA